MSTSLPSPEYLFELAKKDPKALESLRLKEVEQLIENAPEHLKRRLRGLQFQIDCKRRLHPTPLGACIAISQMMLDSLQTLNEALQGRPHCQKELKNVSATVLPFREPSH